MSPHIHPDSYVADPGWSLEPPSWQQNALCLQVDGDLFFAEEGGTVVDAKGVCRRCPVRQECLTFAMEAEAAATCSRFGVYEGMSPTERKRLHAAGWKPGDPTPPVRNAPGWCDECDKPFRNLDQHAATKHPERAA